MARTRFSGWMHPMIAILVAALAACSDGGKKGEDTHVDEGEDTEDDMDVEIEWGENCDGSEDCDDRVDCTVDTCEYGWCVNTPNDDTCSDGMQCNGNEVCDSRDGCVPGDTFRGCDDYEPCTMDVCVEPPDPGSMYSCEHPPLDRDGDTVVDDHCGGTDCDDLDPNTFPGAGEWCFDTKDNDCDLLIDTADDDCLLTNDTCTSPKAVPLGRTVEGFNIGATGNINSACDSSSYADVAYSFTLTETSDVTISVMGRTGWFYIYGDIQTDCGVTTTSLLCEGDSPFRTCLSGLEADTYYLIISSWDVGAFDIRIDAVPTSGPADGDTCSTAVDVSAGGTFLGDLFCASDDVTLGCASWADYKDLVYTFTLTSTQDVHITASSATSSLYGSLMRDCTTPSTYIDCGSDYPFERDYGALAAGTYYLVIETYSPDEFNLDISMTTPSPPPSNDACGGAIDVSAGGVFSGSLVSAHDNGTTSCMSTGYIDAAWVFTTTSTQDVTIDLDGDGDYAVYWALQSACGDRATDIYCETTTPSRHLFRSLAPDTYYIFVESSYQGDYDLEVTFGAPTTACTGITTISASGTFSGDTTSRPDDFRATCGGSAAGPDQAYLVHLDGPSDVLVELTSGHSSTVLHMRTICDDPGSQIGCNYAGGPGFTRLDMRSLGAGDYILVVDGYGTWAYGAYSIRVTITPLGTDTPDG